MKNLIAEAEQIMVVAHGKQKRKTDDSPYINHPRRVALKLKKYDFAETVIAAALVHDVLEDTAFPEKELKKRLGRKVWQIVKEVSEDKLLTWEERKEASINKMRDSSMEAKAVFIADKIHNLEDLIAGYRKIGPEIWDKFNRGKNKKINLEKKLLKMFKSTWQHPLVNEYEALLKQAQNLK